MTFREAARKLFGEVRGLLAYEAFSREALDRFYAMREKLHRPLDHFLRQDERFRRVRREVCDLVDAAGEYVIRLRAEPERRAERRARVKDRLARLEETFHLGADAVGAAPARPTGWRVSRDAKGRLSIRSPANEVGTGVLGQDMLKSVLAAATAAQALCRPAMRPADKRGQPGGLLILDGIERLVIVGDLRARYDHLAHILHQADLLGALGSGRVALVMTGNAFHPVAGRRADAEDFRQAAATLGLVAALKAEHPTAVHYLRGNFDHSHVGGITGGPGVRLDRVLADGLSRLYSGAVVLHYQNFVAACPVALCARGAHQTLLVVHAGVPYGLRRQEELVGALMSGPRSKILEDLLWSRRYDSQALEGVREHLRIEYVLCGYAPFPNEPPDRFGLEQVAESPFAHRQDRLLVVGSHAAAFGYLDVDLTRPPARGVTRLRGPDGRWAMRVLSEG